MTSKREFESLIPESKLQEVKLYCNQSLENSSACELCAKTAVANEFGPTDRKTARCLFSLDFALQASNTKQHTIVLSGAMIGCLVGFFGACSAVWFLWMRRKKSIRMKTNFAKDETSLILGWDQSMEGILPTGSQVAFKRFKNCSVAGDAAFAHEVEVIASVSHVNLVSLRGYCSTTVPLEGHQRIIVCDFMHNGSLYDHLFGSEVKKLSWPIRQKIVLGTARGLAYLHYGAQPAIIHRDIKASNILLDEKFEPKLADFGLANKLTEGSDVYSFGVVLLELLSGKKPLETNEGKAILLTDWAWSLVKKGRALDVIEEGMPELGSHQIMEQYVIIAVLCAHPTLHARPTMEQVVKILETDSNNWSVCPLF
uniref:non-specific serine/threonine protein kinase n=1 Tax=Fagus sylvatica TaxID=28930 RepID=A0A2N9H8Y2_FAGSY